jgi:hypothetical protein
LLTCGVAVPINNKMLGILGYQEGNTPSEVFQDFSYFFEIE